MQITVQRLFFTPRSTCGDMLLNGEKRYATLELPVRDGLPGSAIPPGTYQVIQTYSPHFQRDMPLVIGIPNRSEIEIHWGDYPHDTRGCILIGTSHPAPDEIANSRIAFDDFWELFLAAKHAGEVVSIEIQGGIIEVPSNRDDVQDATAGQ